MRSQNIFLYKITICPTKDCSLHRKFTLSLRIQTKRIENCLDSEVASSICFFKHGIFRLHVRVVKRFRGCVAIFILVVVCSNFVNLDRITIAQCGRKNIVHMVRRNSASFFQQRTAARFGDDQRTLLTDFNAKKNPSCIIGKFERNVICAFQT